MEERNNIKDILRPIALMILIIFLYTNIVSPTYCKYIATDEDSFDITLKPENIEEPNIYLNSNLRVYLNGHKTLRGSGTTWNNLNEEEADGTIVRDSALNSVGGFLDSGNNDFYTFGAEHSGNNATGNNYIRFPDSFDPSGSFTVESTLRFYPIPAISGEVGNSRRNRHYVWSNSDGGGISLEVNYKTKGDELRFIAWIGDTEYLNASNRTEIEAIDHLAKANSFAVLVSDYIPADGSILTVALRYNASTKTVNLSVKDAGDSDFSDYLLNKSLTLGGTYKPTDGAAGLVIGGEPNVANTDSYGAKFDLFTFRLYHAYLDDNSLYGNWRYDQIAHYDNTSSLFYVRFQPTIEAPNPAIVKEYWVQHQNVWYNLGTSPVYTEKSVWPNEYVNAQILSYRGTYSQSPSNVSLGSPCRKLSPSFSYPGLTVITDPIASFLPVQVMSLRATPQVDALTIDDSGVRYLDILELDFVEELGGWPLDTDLSLTFEPKEGYEMPEEIYVTLGEDVYVIDTAYENQYRYVYYYPDSNELWIEQPVFPLDTGIVKIEAVATKIGGEEDPEPTPSPSAEPTAAPSASPSAAPTATSTVAPSLEPSESPSPSAAPSEVPEASPSAAPEETKPDVRLNLNGVSNVTLENTEGEVLANGSATLTDNGSLSVILSAEDEYELPESFTISINGTEYIIHTNGEDNPEGIEFNPATNQLTVSGELLGNGEVEVSFTIDAVVKPTKEEDGENLGTEGDGDDFGGTGDGSEDGDNTAPETPTESEGTGSESDSENDTENTPAEGTPDALPEEGENTEGDNTGENPNGGDDGNGENVTDSTPDDTPAEGTPDATPSDDNKDESGENSADVPTDGSAGDDPSGKTDGSDTEDSGTDSEDSGTGSLTPENSESADSGNTDSNVDSGSADMGSEDSTPSESGTDSGNEAVSETPAVITLTAENPSKVENEK